MTDPAITLPLAEVERMVALLNKLGDQYFNPKDRAALELIQREVAQVRALSSDT